MNREDSNRELRRGEPSVARPVLQFVLAGLFALAVFLVGSIFILRELGRSEGLRDAREFARLAGQGIVEPGLGDGVLTGDRGIVAALDRIVQERVLGERVVRVKIWTRDGRIVYSDEPRLIGDVYPLDDAKQDALRTGSIQAELSDLTGTENRFERSQGDLYEVYLPIRTSDGTPLLFETYQRAGSVAQAGRRIWLPFAGLLLASLVLLWLVQVPLAWGLARRLSRSQAEREVLLIKAAEASEDERRRIAADLHDGVVQDLAGVSYALSAAAESEPARESPELRETLHESAVATREGMRQLRSLLVEIHPPNLHAEGLEVALRDLLSPLPARGIQTELKVGDGEGLRPEVELLFYRAAREAIRNVQSHAHARRVTVRVSADGDKARLEVVDDGVGFTTEAWELRRREGHVGLTLLEELAERMNGGLEVQSRPGEGTRLELEVPSS